MSRSFVSFGDTHDFAVNEGARTITGLAVPWNKVARNNGTNWRFERGGITYADMKRVKLLRDHDNGQALGKAIAITDTDQGLVMTFKVSPGPEGDRALALAADEVLDGLSIGVEWSDQDFDADPLNPGAFLVKRANLREVSLTAVPAFDDSRLTSVRASDVPEKGPVMPENEKKTETTPVTPAAVPAAVTPPTAAPVAPTAVPATPAGVTFSAEQFAAFMAAHTPTKTEAILPAVAQTPVVEPRPTVDPTARPTQAATFVAEPLPYRFTHVPRHGTEAGKHVFHNEQEHSFSGDVFSILDNRDRDGSAAARVQAMIKGAFAVTETNVAGLNPVRQAPELWQPQMDYATPLWDMINSGSTDGRPFVLPKFSSASGLVAPATPGTEPAPGAMAVTTQTITPTQVWGKVEIERQAIRQVGNPQLDSILWDQMLREYYEDREAAVATFLNTLTAAVDIVLTVPTGPADNDEKQAIAASLEAGIAGLQFVRGGNRFTAFAVHQDLYKVLASVTDDAGRPLYPMIAPQNANGGAQPLFKTMDVAGTRAVPSWALGNTSTDPANSWLFDPAKVRGWASAPERLDWNFGATVQSNNITQLAYVTVGIYGDIALANLDINGVRQVIADVTGS